MKLPSEQQARQFLKEAEMRNPGPWVAHSLNVGAAARFIAEKIPSLDAQKAYLLGLLHDIGRREGITGMRHTYDGYRFLVRMGFPDAARICLTHSFPIKDIQAGSSQWDCTPNEMKEIKAYLDANLYNDYDRLLQLCDALAIPSGFCLLEKRFVDVLMRYRNFNAFTIPKWEALFQLKKHFDRLAAESIYELLPGIKANTFS